MLPIYDFVAHIYQENIGVESAEKQAERRVLYDVYDSGSVVLPPESDNVMIAALSYATYHTLLTGDNVVFVARDAYHAAATNVIRGRSVGQVHTLTVVPASAVENSALRGRRMSKIFVPRDYSSSELMAAIAVNGVAVYKY